MRTRSRVGQGYWTRGGIGLQTAPYYVKATWGLTNEPYLGVFGKMGVASKAVYKTDVKEFSSIIDIEHGKGSINYCSHQKLKIGNGEFDHVTADGNTQYSNWGFYKCRRIAPPASSSLVTLVNHPIANYGRQVRAWRDLQPTYENTSGFSGVNTLLEAREFKRMPGQILRLSRSLVEAARNVLRKDSSKTLAELALTYEYGFRPTVQDAVALSLTAGQAGAHLKRFNTQGDQWNTRHYKEEMPEETLSSPWGEYIDYQRKSGIYVASLRCNYHQVADNAFATFLTYHGLTLSPAQIWEAIPFSFLIDQVFTVGKTLERLSRTAVTKINYGAFLESYKMTTTNVRCMRKASTLRYFNGGCSSVGVDVGDDHPLSYAQLESYTRYISSPPALSGVPLPQFKSPSIRNLVDDLALLRSGVGWRADNRTLFNGPKD